MSKVGLIHLKSTPASFTAKETSSLNIYAITQRGGGKVPRS
jgi:hypothetical protein